ncbi:MAG TPA: leucine/isoleucine/valine transporter permease subunit [Acidimicrobiia bacterium]|nr:leucine/isoleucine/valine transporter permease subunit [Acidimicrobiia bacterium]
MAQTTKTPTAAPPGDLPPTRQNFVDLVKAAEWGLVGGATATFVSAIGMVPDFDGRTLIDPFLTLGYLVLFLVPFAFGYMAARPLPTLEGQEPVRVGPKNVLAGAIAGTVTGLVLFVPTLVAVNFNLRSVFVNLSPAMADTLTLGQSLGVGLLLLVVLCLVAGAMGAGVNVIPARWRVPVMTGLLWVLTVGLLEDLATQLLRGLNLDALVGVFFAPGGGLKPAGAIIVFVLVFSLQLVFQRRPPGLKARYQALDQSERRRWTIILIAATAVIVYLIPIVLGGFMSEILDLVGIYLLMALGLNIVIGFAGLLDLGYVAFFAVGAYMTAVLTSPGSPALTPELTFWAALPFVVLAAALSGVLVGTPVLRMRGDYLAIVTLGFGEIARILFLSDWFDPVFGGAQGITQIPSPSIGPFEINTPPQFFYPIIVMVFVAAYISWALANSRIGRAWNAIREDEPIAEALGVNIVTAKLSAFVVGAALASFAGALFASKIGAVFPNSFSIIVSIIVLVIIIVGGMGNLAGVAVGALVIVGLPQLLREFDEYRFLLYGALLIFMMLAKPEGIIPSRRRVAELHQEEMSQDAWLTAEPESELDEARTTPATAKD